MRFAYQTIIYGWKFQDAKARNRAFEFIADCGFEGIELFQKTTFEELGITCSDLLAELRSHNLDLIGLTGGDLNHRVEFLDTHFTDKSSRFKAPFLYTDSAGVLEILATLELGYRVALHPHVFKPIHNLDDVLTIWHDPAFKAYTDLRTKNKQLLLLPDTAHGYIVGDDIIGACRRFQRELAAVHIKGWNGAYGRMSHRYAQGFCLIGDGHAPVKDVLTELKKDETYADPWVVVEQDYTPHSPENAILQSANTLEKWGYRLNGKRKLSPEPPKDPRPQDSPLAMFELELRRRLEAISETELDKFYLSGLEATRIALGLKGAALLGLSEIEEVVSKKVTEKRNKVTVLALSPADGDIKDSPQWPIASAPGGDEVSTGWEKLLWKELCHGQSIEIDNPYNLNQHRYQLAVCGLSEEKKDRLIAASECLGRFLDQRLNDACLLAAGNVALHAARATRLDEFVDKLQVEIRSSCHCEASVLMVANPSGNKLVPVGTEDNLEWIESRRSPSSRAYQVDGDKKTRTIRVFTRRMPVRTEEPSDPKFGWRGLSHLRLTRKTQEGNAFILLTPMIDALGKSAGVARSANRYFQDKRNRQEQESEKFEGGIRFFHDDDLAILDAILQTALPRIKTLRGEWWQRSQIRKVTHELKRPVVVIGAAIASIEEFWIRRMHQYGFPDLPFHWFEDVKSWGALMRLQLLNPDYLAVESSKVKLKLEPVNFLPDVLAAIVRSMRVELERKELPLKKKGHTDQFTIDQGDSSLPTLYVDKIMFQQIFFNLIDNAIKYAKPNDPDSFSIIVRSQFDYPNYVITFSDYGIGVQDVGNPESLFEDGFRAENAWRHDLNGTGYGLWIVRRLVEFHNGTIRITNKKDPTEFTLTFPASLSDPDWYEKFKRGNKLS